MLHHVIDWEQAIRECVRVLRPGGVFVGYDLLANPGSRFIHVVDRSRNPLLTMPELEAFVSTIDADAEVRPFRREAAVRFRFGAAHVSTMNG